MPQAAPSFTSTIALDFTLPQTRQASSTSAHSRLGRAAAVVTTRQSRAVDDEAVGVLHEAARR